MKNKRLVGLDVFRGWAILLMVVFHFSYDLNYFHFIEIHLRENIFWRYARYLIVAMFLFSVGVSLALVHQSTIDWKKVYKRALLLGGASIVVTIATYIEFPHRWVYFGILHFVWVASLVGLLFIAYPRFSFFVAIFIFIGYYDNILGTHALFSLLESPLNLPKHTEDLVKFFPWFGIVLFGISIVGVKFHKKLFGFFVFSSDNYLNKFLGFTGRYSLLIYLLHQPLLFGFLMLFHKFLLN